VVLGRRILRFRAAGVACACDLDPVREIVRARPLVRLPGAPAWVLGIMNLRGTMLTVVDLSRRLQAGASGTPAFVVVVESGGKRLGIGVEAVQSVGGELDGEMGQWCDVDAIAQEALA
jgi:purine-binding chemotaxis protein CheW